MRAAAEKAGKEMTASGRQESEDSIRVMRDDWNLSVRSLEEAEAAKWQAISTEAYGHIRDNTVPGEVWDQVVRILEDYRAAQ